MKQNSTFDYKSYTILDKKEVGPETFLFRLEGRSRFLPGQFIQASLDHFGRITLIPCSDPEEKDFFEICIRSAGSTSKQMVLLSPGDQIKIRGPYGNGWPISKLIGKNVLLIAGGIGFIPLRPLIYQLLKYKSEFKKIYLVAGFKSDYHIPFEEELKELKDKINYLKVTAEHVERNFWGEHGLVTDTLKKIDLDAAKTRVLMCGPEVMLPFCEKVLSEKGMEEKNIYISFERRMECGVGICQHCNIGKYLVCKDGPVFPLDKIKDEIGK